MPEKAKVNSLEETSSKAEEPGIGAKKGVMHPVENASVELKAASPSPEIGTQEPEAFKDSQPKVSEREVLGEKVAHQFADLIANGTAEAAETGEEEDPGEGSDSSGHGYEEGFFTGWDGLDEIHELSAEEEIADEEIADEEEQTHQAFEGVGGHRTLSEIALASGALQTLEGSGNDGSGLSSKHDELADAVQAALMSVYGEETPSVVPSRKALPFSPEPHASGPGWSNEDNLSPQDVILNYFDYQPGPGTSRGDVSNHAYTGYSGNPPGVFDQPRDYPSPQHRPQWPSSPDAPEYDDVPAYSPSEGHTAPSKATDAAERESSRLLGAAAIGLVGGIAIAASLAIFVISSYGPGGRTAPGAANQALDASPPGYGRWVKGNAEADTSKAAAAASPSPSEAAPLIAAADVPVTSGRPSPLAIEVKPEQANEATLISITGIPEGARLNAGVDAGGGNWLLPPRRLNGLTINVPAGTPDTVSLDVQVLDSNLRTPLSDKKQFAIRVNAAQAEPAAPASVQSVAAAATPPKTQPELAALQRTEPETPVVADTPKPPRAAPSFFSTETVPSAGAAIAPQAESSAKPASLTGAGPQTVPSRQAALQAPGALGNQPKFAPRTEIEDLIRDGNKRMKEGDILEARRVYQKAVALGGPEAALAMGRSYDPIYFARIDRKNAEPDAAKAFDWYRKAMDGGASQTAKVRIENLKHYLNQ